MKTTELNGKVYELKLSSSPSNELGKVNCSPEEFLQFLVDELDNENSPFFFITHTPDDQRNWSYSGLYEVLDHFKTRKQSLLNDELVIWEFPSFLLIEYCSIDNCGDGIARFKRFNNREEWMEYLA